MHRLGLDAVIARNTDEWASPVWENIDNARDVTLNLEAGEADVSTRGNNGWRALVATIKDASVDFEMVWDTEDANFTAIRTAFMNKTAIELVILDGPPDEAGSQGLRAMFQVFSFSRAEPLEEALTVSVTVKPTYSPEHPPEWYTVPAET